MGDSLAPFGAPPSRTAAELEQLHTSPVAHDLVADSAALVPEARVLVVAVHWYLRYCLSYRDIEELLIERGVEVDQVTVYR